MNKFDEPINVTRVDFITYGLCFSFTWSNTSIDRVILQPNKTEKVITKEFDSFTRMNPKNQNEISRPIELNRSFILH
jgi:hypothetical protein